MTGPAQKLGDVLGAIGNTPLVRLKGASDLTGCDIYGKAEFLNPGQSVKDRAALWIIRDAERRGALRPGGTIVEGTAGNTGIGLAMVGNALGYKTVIVLPRTQSQEKKDAIRSLGAKLVEVDAVPYSNPMHYARYSGKLAEELASSEPNGAIWANQFDNLANRQSHYDSTGPEIWEQTGGKVDGFICAVGSGGTLGGVSLALKERSKDVQIGIADPFGAALYAWYKDGELKSEGNSITEGIGQGRITANLEGVVVDRAYRIGDEEMLKIVFDLVQHEGMCLGGSSGVNVAGAIALAKDLGPGKTIVTILCDYGSRYQSKLFNPAFLKEKGLPTPPWMEEPA
jgi:cysteine synthase